MKAPAYMWRRRELSNYLLVPGAIARASGMSIDDLFALLRRLVDDMQEEVFASLLGEADAAAARLGVPVTATTGHLEALFDREWADEDARFGLVPARTLLARLNTEIVTAGHRPVTALQIARRLTPAEVASELVDLFRVLDGEAEAIATWCAVNGESDSAATLRQERQAAEPPQSAADVAAPASAEGKYGPLTARLEAVPPDEPDIALTFRQIGDLVRGLPASARHIRSWWANSSHVQAQAWRAAGWHIPRGGLDFDQEMVTFQRGTTGSSTRRRDRT